jgi:NCS2 family nucleobase:cation symporter-2/xanthine permease XanP
MGLLWPVRATLLVAIQHVLAMFVGVITVPLLVAHSLKLPPDETGYLISMGLVASGLGTMVQVRGIGFFGSRLLAVQGTSFAFLVPLIQAGQAGGLALMLGMSLLCAPVELVLAQFLTRFQRLFTPLVSGTVVLPGRLDSGSVASFVPWGLFPGLGIGSHYCLAPCSAP